MAKMAIPWYNRRSISRLFPSLERSGAQCLEKDGTAKITVCIQERAKEKTGGMLTNTLIALEKYNSSMLGS